METPYKIIHIAQATLKYCRDMLAHLISNIIGEKISSDQLVYS
jgi:hypothetical protein